MKNETSITVGFVALYHEENVLIGDTRREWQREAKIVPLKIRSVETGGFIIEPVEDIFLGKFEIRGVTPVSSPASDASMPHLEEPGQMKIYFDPVQSLAIVRTRENKLAFADLGDDEETALPKDAQLVGVVPAPAGTFEVTAHDSLTEQNNKLGYHFAGTVPGTWADLALRKREAAQAEERRRQEEIEKERRQAAERAEQEAAAAQKRREAEAQPVEMFETADSEVAARLREVYRPALISIKKVGVKYLVADYEDYGKEIAIAVQNERAELRRQNMDPDQAFAKRREERAEALAAR
jgi:hypothetical protein